MWIEINYTKTNAATKNQLKLKAMKKFWSPSSHGKVRV